MSKEINTNSTKGVNRIGATGIVIGTLTVLACELPIVLALVGLGGLSTAAASYSLPSTFEIIGITIGILGLLLVVGLTAYRAIVREKH